MFSPRWHNRSVRKAAKAPSSNDLKDVLIFELEQCREDDRNAVNQIFTTITTAGTVAAACFALPSILEKGALLLISAAVSYVSSVGMLQVVRHHYIKDTEKALSSKEISDGAVQPIMHWRTLSTTVTTLNIKHLKQYAILYFSFIFLAVLSMLAFCVGFFLWIVAVDAKWVLDIFRNCSLLVILYCSLMYLFITQRSQKIYKFAKDRAEEVAKNSGERREFGFAQVRAEEVAENPKKHREFALKKWCRVVFYFILPRPLDVPKAGFIIAGFWAASAIVSTNRLLANWLLCLETLLIFDILTYQARYQVNDIRGLAEDLEHSSKHDRLRLPADILGIRCGVYVSFVVIFLKICLAIYLAYKFETGVRTYLIWLVLISLLAFFYERSRAKEEGKRTINLVGCGYALRFSVGFFAEWLAVEPQNLLPPIIWTSIFAVISYFWGRGFVAMTWALEAAHVMRKNPEGRLKSHLQYLYEQIPDNMKSDDYPLKKAILTKTTWDRAYCISIILFSITVILVAIDAIRMIDWPQLLLSLLQMVSLFWRCVCRRITLAAIRVADWSRLSLSLLQIASVFLWFFCRRITLEKSVRRRLLYIGIALLFIFELLCALCYPDPLYKYFLGTICVYKLLCFMLYISFRLNNYEGLYFLRNFVLAVIKAIQCLPKTIWRGLIGEKTYALLQKEKNE